MSVEIEWKNDSVVNELSPVTAKAADAVQCMEDIIGKDEGNRGMSTLVVPGDLLKAAKIFARLQSKQERNEADGQRRRPRVLILSGFPCCVDYDPPTETDGPPGAFAIARAAIGLGYSAVIITDQCNQRVFEAAFHQTSSWTKNCLTIEIFPPEMNMSVADTSRMEDMIRHNCDLVIACERAGPAKDGNCYTMRGANMTERGLIAPLHRIVDLVRKSNVERDSGDLKIEFIAIGDGGNELGMGKMYQAVVSNPKIENGELIAAVMAADFLIAASVSNWGGYSLATASFVVRFDDIQSNNGINAKSQSPEDFFNICVTNEDDEVALLERCVAVGCRDGVSGEIAATVDGMPLKTSMKCLEQLRLAALQIFQ